MLTSYALFFKTKNVFYTLFYFILVVFFLGLLLSFLQLEVYTGFLWVVECVIVFALILLFISEKPTSNWQESLDKLNILIYPLLLSFFILLEINTYSIFSHDTISTILLNVNCFWEQYYEALKNFNANDLIATLISYYSYNANLLLLLGFLILVVSVILIILNKFIVVNNVQSLDAFLRIFSFFKNEITVFFLRQQNLTNQQNKPATSRILKRKQKIKKNTNTTFNSKW